MDEARGESRGTPALGSRQGGGAAPIGRRILAAATTKGVVVRGGVMADLAYALVLIGGFALLVLTMRGLQRL